jgi:hypothetical protein
MIAASAFKTKTTMRNPAKIFKRQTIYEIRW